uniref:Uncharacterized protein n=1 Tax=Myoviridae sp. ctp7F23 TaxID=2825174 RepID=A0A8S5U8K6_9CAUD|nr:MAG TPA: Protein of unknown function (DUF722) [Myoviridae sp. ctp7F23]
MDRDEKEDREILKFVLEQIYRAKRRKGQLDRRLENLKRDMQSAPGSQGRGRRTSGDHGDGTANLVVKKSSIEERIERQKDNVSISIEKTMDLLELLPETSLEREIMELRHLDMKDWKDIADSIYMSRSQCNKRYNAGLDYLLQQEGVQVLVDENRAVYQKHLAQKMARKKFWKK